MTDLEPGLYWVKPYRDGEWEVARIFERGGYFWIGGHSDPYNTVAIIGPRLTPPEGE